jgi:hypothetical protein
MTPIRSVSPRVRGGWLVGESGSDDSNGYGPGDSPSGRRAARTDGPGLPIRCPLGRIVATPGARAALERAGVKPVRYSARHASCDWGDVDARDWAANDRALVDGERLLSAYVLPTGERIRVITESDRSTTTMLMPHEY